MFVLLVIFTTSPPVGQAAFPGTNGKIAFQTFRDGNAEVYVMNADGSGQTNLSNNPADDTVPDWSPNGAKLAFQTCFFKEGDYYESLATFGQLFPM
jgi:Tol biopolymer transport system component